MLVVKSLEQALEMRSSGQQDENVEDLVRRTPDVEGAGIEAFGYTRLFVRQIEWIEVMRVPVL